MCLLDAMLCILAIAASYSFFSDRENIYIENGEQPISEITTYSIYFVVVSYNPFSRGLFIRFHDWLWIVFRRPLKPQFSEAVKQSHLFL